MSNKHQGNDIPAQAERPPHVIVNAPGGAGTIGSVDHLTQTNVNTGGGPAYISAQGLFDVRCPDPPRGRIFISHYADGQDDGAVLLGLSEALGSSFEVLFDTCRFETDSHRSDSLYTWMDLSHAAVILLSHAALTSEWVATEASILCARKLIDRRFVIVPVLLDQVTLADLSASRLADLDLAAFLPISGDTPENSVSQVVARLSNNIKIPPKRTPLEELLCGVYKRLHQFKDLIPDIAEKLDLDLDSMIPRADPLSCLAREMWQGERKLNLVLDVAQALKNYYLSEWKNKSGGFADIAEVVSSAWIDPCSVVKLSGLLFQPGTHRGAQVNSRLPNFTAQRLLSRATYKPQPATIVMIDGVTGEDVDLEDLKTQIREGLYVTLRVPPKELPSITDQLLELNIKGRSVPVVIVVPLDYPLDYLDEDIVGSVQDFLPSAIFFFVDRSNRSQSQLRVPLNLTVVWPPPDPDTESLAFLRHSELHADYQSAAS